MKRIMAIFLCLGSTFLWGTYYSQYGQDKYVYETYFKDVTDGVFVDVGAFDGVTFSNSYFFEKELGWKGLCIEPIPEVFAKLRHHRKCHCIQGCVNDTEGSVGFLHVAKTEKTPPGYHLEMLSGIHANYDSRHLQRVAREIASYNGESRLLTMPCYTLNTLFKENGFYHINFLSVDTEGGELQILKSIAFNKCIIDVIAVEDNYGSNELHDFMSNKGYRLDKKIGSDCIFVRNDLRKCTVMNPVDLITPQRMDVLAKLFYVQQVDLGLKSQWGAEIYAEHLKCWNNLYEKRPPRSIVNYHCAAPYKEKKRLSDWTHSFDALIHSVQSRGFDRGVSRVPYNEKTFVLLDGAHRLATALYYNVPLFCEKFKSGGEPVTADFLCKKGMPRKYLDAMAYQYAKVKKNTYIVNLFPSAEGFEQEVLNILSRYGKIVYRKDVQLSRNGPLNLVRMLYEGETWLGNRYSNYPGAWLKVRGCFPKKAAQHTVRVFLFECPSLELVKEAKSSIRSLFKIGNDSVHVNDTHSETMQLAQTFFNNNSLHFLNNSSERGFLKFETFVSEYKKGLEQSGADFEHFCIDGSAILAAYGLRDCNDLDVLHWGGFPKNFAHHPFVGSHNQEMRFHVLNKDEIIFNPEYHFYYRGIKFASPRVLWSMKKNRGERKDHHDCRLLSNIF